MNKESNAKILFKMEHKSLLQIWFMNGETDFFPNPWKLFVVLRITKHVCRKRAKFFPFLFRWDRVRLLMCKALIYIAITVSEQ